MKSLNEIQQARVIITVILSIMVSISLLLGVCVGTKEPYTIVSSKVVEKVMCNCGKHVAHYKNDIVLSSNGELGFISEKGIKSKKPLSKGEVLYYSSVTNSFSRERWGVGWSLLGVFYVVMSIIIIFRLLMGWLVADVLEDEDDELNEWSVRKSEYCNLHDLTLIILGFKLSYAKKRLIVDRKLTSSYYTPHSSDAALVRILIDYYKRYKKEIVYISDVTLKK